MNERLTSTSFTTTLDMNGEVWYTDYSELDIENLTMTEEDND